MTAEDNKNLNLHWIQAFNERDWATEATCRTADYRADMQGARGPLDAAGWASFMGLFTTAFSDVEIAVDASISEGDIVAGRWTMTRTHSGDFLGVPASGRQIRMKCIDFSRVVEGKIAEHWAQYDVVGVLQQIGAMPAPA